MLKSHRALLVAALAAALTAFVASAAFAQSKGKIVCWKDKSGKTLGCGESVPPEFQDSATSELTRQGVTRKTTESAEEAARRRAQEQNLAKQRADEKKKAEEQKRQDSALLNSYSSEKEIDLRRDRDLQVVDTQISSFRTTLKNAADRLVDAKTRLALAEKSKKPSDVLSEEVTRAEAEKAKAERSIADREKEKEDIRKRYAELKDRYIKLRGGTTTTAATPAPAPAPAAPAKK
ncbi:MAG: hypothetical protein HYV99_00530 [Betaproteobacteria bacterium]|nr:hypothetical protein [Betaproteobacteria bacterium]